MIESMAITAFAMEAGISVELQLHPRQKSSRPTTASKPALEDPRRQTAGASWTAA
jgi:hypothetical protein